jgi:outer membrane protein TolC
LRRSARAFAARCCAALFAFGALAGLGAISSPADAEEHAVVGIPGQAGVSTPLTVTECVEAAVESNATLAQERFRRDELTARGWQAASTGLPSVDVTGTWLRSRDPSFLLGSTFSGSDAAPIVIGGDTLDFGSFIPTDPNELPADTYWRSSLNATWDLNPFRVFNAIRGADIAIDQQDYRIEDTENRIAEATMATFYEIALHRERAQALEAEMAARREFLDISRRRFELELATELDTLQAAVSLANLAPELRRANKDLRNAAARLNIIMGRDPVTPLTILSELEIEREDISAALAAARAEERPDVRALELQEAFLHKQKGVYKADLRPSLSFNGSYGYVARTFDDLTEREYDYWNADVTLVIPLFDGFYAKGRVKETNASLARAQEALVESRRQARLEVATALEELEAAHENHDAAGLNLKAAEDALERVTLRYDLGKANYLEVLNSQSERFAARTNLIRARYDVLVQTAALKRALGFSPIRTLAECRESLERSSP